MHMCLVLFKRFVDSSPHGYFVYPQLSTRSETLLPTPLFPIQLTIRGLVEKVLGPLRRAELSERFSPPFRFDSI